MYVVVGLGNPGRKYEHTRHNVGFDVVDVLAQRNNISLARLRCKAVVGEGIISGQRVALALPQTYMNLSGESVVPVSYTHLDVYKRQAYAMPRSPGCRLGFSKPE